MRETLYELYEHHGNMVKVRSVLRGLHRQHCLCWEPCKFFKPGETGHCEIANAVYKNCVNYGIVTPMWECPKFELKIVEREKQHGGEQRRKSSRALL